MTPKVKIFQKMSFQTPRWDTEVSFVTKFGENRPLRNCQKVAWITTQKTKQNWRSAGLVPAPILHKMGRSRPKFPERCHPLTCPRILNLVRIGCILPELFRKDRFFCPKSQYNIGFQPTMNTTDWVYHYLHESKKNQNPESSKQSTINNQTRCKKDIYVIH